MAVYVDNMRRRARVGKLNAIWCHLTADTTEELHAFALSIGLKRSWFQPGSVYPDTPALRLLEKEQGRKIIGTPRRGGRDHYDVTEGKRKLAVEAGAIEVSWGCEPWRERKRKQGEGIDQSPAQLEGQSPSRPK